MRRQDYEKRPPPVDAWLWALTVIIVLSLSSILIGVVTWLMWVLM